MLIVIDPRRIDQVKTPHIAAAHHLPLRPGTNMAVVSAIAHQISRAWGESGEKPIFDGWGHPASEDR